MPSFADPLWLLLVALIPVVRWIHQWHASLRRYVVPALFLWQDESDTRGTGNVRRDPDPAWRRRALAVGLLALALAEPRWPVTESRLTVWIDDSPSMFAREGGKTRIESAFLELQQLADADQSAEIQLRSLGDPEFVQRYDGSDDIDAWIARSPSAPQPPPGSLMTPNSAHWLITDGASDSVRLWAARAPLDRIVNVGEATENVSIVLLGARRPTELAAGLDIVVAAVNGGRETQQRNLLLRADGRILGERLLSIEPGQSIESFFRIQDLPSSVSAGLRSTDALPGDDDLQIDLHEFQPALISVDPDCPVSVTAVVDAHPALQLAGVSAEPAVEFDCNVEGIESGDSAARPRVQVLAGEVIPVSARPAWNMPAAEMPGFGLAPEWVHAAAWPGGTAGDEILLLAAGQPLVASSRTVNGATTVDTVIDLERDAFTRQPEYALFVSQLVELALDQPILDFVASVSRDAAHAEIAPVIVEPLGGHSAASVGAIETDLARWILLAAMLVVLRDSGIFLIRRRRDGHA